MVLRFEIPQRPEDLESDGGREELLRVLTVKQWDLITDDEVVQTVEYALFELDSSDSLQTCDQACFDALYATVKLFNRVPPRLKTKVVDVLCGNVLDITSSLKCLLASEFRTGEQSVLLHRNAMQQYVFLLDWLSMQADIQSEGEAREKRQLGQDVGAGKSVPTL
ncbi:uncharacterized protein HaLaN_29422 [Haematococcus lacustris]|uniref:Uncharacterized protein n=1 Tax=Haematococcus lacustris TaxID=44745 RepID=A0A6A0ACZ4_HAELA|nr:uncharacterized protein HaLaN_29422 [Haematococcus lacustris]